ncbi:glycosyltransferase family 2 protein [uncultured Alistipes sp.]|jgi:hypothetical protein|uniref:glycosyltransferase family 2 protein n=1 Tax=uncultured Alistipes sp. TaxID=538949 RepID=UPI0025D9339D|nr:glycosyltransferase family 2 protein [uncultured Alistipes sp.]
MDYQYKYSVIVPHKNAPDLLRRFLASVPRRKEIQIIIVDDNSDPGLVDFDNFPGADDPFVEVYLTKEGRGGGYGRNVGLDHAKGEWLLFGDADDFYNEGAFDVFDRYADKGIDILHYCIDCRDSDTLEPATRGVPSNDAVKQYFLYPEKKNNEENFRFRNFGCWNKMIRHDFFTRHKIRFEEPKVNIDVFFSFQVGLFEENFKVIDDELYCITVNPGSITFVKRSVEREFEFYKMSLKRNGFYRKMGLRRLVRPNYLYMPYILVHYGPKFAYSFYCLCLRNRKLLKECYNDYVGKLLIP